MTRLDAASGDEIRGDGDSGAVFSRDGQYRYMLWRRWKASPRTLMFIMLNPSTADENELDPTLRRCKGFAERWGFDSFVIGNVYALRSTNPKELWAVDDPVGERNAYWLERAARGAEWIVAAWGTLAKPKDVATVMTAMDRVEQPLMCLGVTKAGHPCHPLYLKNSTLPRVYSRGQFQR